MEGRPFPLREEGSDLREAEGRGGEGLEGLGEFFLSVYHAKRHDNL